MNRTHELSPGHRNRWQPIQAHIFSAYRAKRDNIRTERTEVTYSYTVDGELYLGEFTDYGKVPPQDLQRGAIINVLYNPDKPSESRLDRHNSFGWWQIVWPVIGVSIVVLKFLGHGIGAYLIEHFHRH